MSDIPREETTAMTDQRMALVARRADEIQPFSRTRLRFARNPALRLRIIPPMNGAITRMRPSGSMSILRVTRHPWPSGTTVNVVVGSSFPIRTSKTIPLGGSYSETVTVPPDTPMTGFVLISKVEPLSTVVPSISLASRTSVCHRGSFRTSAMKAKTSTAGRATDSVPSVLIMAPPRVYEELPNVGAREPAFVNRQPGDGDGRVVPLRQLGRQRIRDRAVVLLALNGLDEIPRGREVLGVDLHVELHRRGVRVDLDDRELASLLVEVRVERDQPRLVRLDEVNHLRQTLAGFLELPGLDRRRSDVDKCSGHGLLPSPLKSPFFSMARVPLLGLPSVLSTTS